MSFRAVPAITVFVAAAMLCVATLATVRSAGDASEQVRPPAGLSAFPQPRDWPALRSQSVAAERIGPGVSYQRWTLDTAAGPLLVSLAQIDLRDPSVQLAVTTQNGAITGPGVRLSEMADSAGAELGVNADYFDIGGSGSPLNIVVEGGRILHAPDQAAAFAVDASGHIHMGALGLRLLVENASGVAIDVRSVNDWSPAVDLALVTPELGPNAGGGATEVVLAPQAGANEYRVTSVQTDLLQLASLAVGQLGLVARGAQADLLVRDLHPGDPVSVTVQTDPDVEAMQAAVGGGPLLVQDGKPVADAAPPAPEETLVRNPVTGAGLSADGGTLWIVVVDGRRPALSIGLTRPQLADLFVALGATTAMAFDSGGSSEMVIRHLGDRTTSVANAPSDGRERAIADALVVLNTAAPGPVSRLFLRAPAGQVLVGSTLHVDVRAVDANDQPVTMQDGAATLSSDAPAVAAIDSDGDLHALAVGTARVSALAAGASASAVVQVVSGVDELAIVPAKPSLAAGATMVLGVEARTRDGQLVAVDPGAVRWSSNGQTSSVRADGTFVAGLQPASTLVSATVGGASASAVVLSGEHAMVVQALPSPGPLAPAWHYACRPSGLSGAVDALAAPDGAPALRLAYDFSTTQAPRAAYAQSKLTLPGEPIALALDIYGDGGGAWLRAGYLNADGNSESITIARHVDWRGWRTLRVAIPPQASWPVTWTRIYLVEPSKTARETGAIWLRDLTLFFAGP